MRNEPASPPVPGDAVGRQLLISRPHGALGGRLSETLEPTSPYELTIREGCLEKLGDWFFSSDPIPGNTSDGLLHIDQFTKVFLRLLGSEVESREIRLGILIGPTPDTGTPLVQTEELLESEGNAAGFGDPRRVVRVYRQRIVGRANGTLGQSSVLVEPSDGRILGLYRVSTPTMPRNTHQQYEMITEDLSYSAIWLKPAASARLYREGRFVAQVIQLRDGLGWTIRIIDDLLVDIERAIRAKTGLDPDARLLRTVVEVACELSELREGGSVYLVRDAAALADLAGESGKGPQLVSIYRPERGGLPLYTWDHEAVINLLSQDGAVIVALHGSQLLASQAYFSGPGGRRQIAQSICCNDVVPVAAVVVSQDGPLYVAGMPDPENGRELFEVDRVRYI